MHSASARESSRDDREKANAQRDHRQRDQSIHDRSAHRNTSQSGRDPNLKRDIGNAQDRSASKRDKSRARAHSVGSRLTWEEKADWDKVTAKHPQPTAVRYKAGESDFKTVGMTLDEYRKCTKVEYLSVWEQSDWYEAGGEIEQNCVSWNRTG